MVHIVEHLPKGPSALILPVMAQSEPSSTSAPRIRDRGHLARRSARWNIAHTEDDTAVAGSQSLQRALVLLNLVGVIAADRPAGVGLAELARSAGRPKPSVHRMLAALVQAGYVERLEPAGTYRLGHQALVLGELARSLPDPLRQHAHDGVVRLAELSEDTSFLTLRQGSFSICVQREEGSGPIRNNALGVGDRHPLGIGAGSLAILAALEDAEVESVLARNAGVLQQQYPRIDPAVLRQVVARTRADGYALNEGLVAPGSWAVGMAIRGATGQPVGAFSVASIEHRLGRERREELAAAMRDEAAIVERALAEPGADPVPIPPSSTSNPSTRSTRRTS